MAGYFGARGIEPGDKIGLMSKTRYEWTLIDFATWFAGAVLAAPDGEGLALHVACGAAHLHEAGLVARALADAAGFGDVHVAALQAAANGLGVPCM